MDDVFLSFLNQKKAQDTEKFSELNDNDIQNLKKVVLKKFPNIKLNDDEQKALFKILKEEIIFYIHEKCVKHDDGRFTLKN